MFAVIYIEDFALQAVLRHTPALCSQPVALIDGEETKPLILQCTPAAKACGVVGGLTPSQAMARCPQLEIKARSAAQEQSAMETLLQTAYAFSPNIEATAPGICTLETKGLGLEKPVALKGWSQKLRQMLESFYFEVTLGTGATPDLALLAAHAGIGQAAVVTSANGDFAARLPIAALAPPADIGEILARWGIRTVGEFLALGRAEVAERLGERALELFARVSANAVRPLRLVAPPEHFSEQIEFENEIETVEPLLVWLRRFLDQLTRRLEAVYLVVGQLQLRLGLASGAIHEREFKIPAPTGDAAVLFRTLLTHLETVRTDSAIVSLQLVATPASPDSHQFGLFQNTLRNPNQFAETFTRLAALVGPENVGTPAVEATHRPDAFRLQPPNFEFVPAADVNAREAGDGLQFRRLRPPLPAQLEFQEGQPARIASSRFAGAVVEARGPFLSSGNWWDDSHWAREEWDVATAGGALLRLFRSRDGCFVEGVYD